MIFMPIKSNKVEQDPDLKFFLERKSQLKQARLNSGIEEIWRQAEADYLPHELGTPKKKYLVENIRTEVSTFVNLARDEWRSKVSKNEPFIKIQTALSVLFDRNPEAYFEPGLKRFEATTNLVQELYHKTWANPVIGSKRELRKFIFTQAQYGWAPARRYYKRVVRKDMMTVDKFNTQTNEFEYKKQDMIDVDDVFFESKSPWDCWIDDMAKPDDPRSRRDWMWKETYDKETFEATWPKMKGKINFTSLTSSEVNNNNTSVSTTQQKFTSTNLAEVWFYENRILDKFLIICQDKLVDSTPLQRTDKELSLVDTYWLMRNPSCPYGIGVNEIMRGNKVLLDRIRNMTIDQVVLSIYKMFFYSNAEQLDDEGGETIQIEPGKGKKVIDPKNISWLVQPGPGQDAYSMIEMLKKDIEDDTGITRTLGGEVTGKTLGEVVEAKEGALKRLATPLRNIKTALEWDAKLCVTLMQMVYSVPKVFSFTDPELIKEYIAQVEDDKDRYFVDINGVFNAIKYREFQLNLEKSPTGLFQKSEQKSFWMVKPSLLDWQGDITIKVESMVEMSKPLERQMKLEMSNLLLPLIEKMSLSPSLVPVLIKPVKQILKLYEEDPTKWLADEFLNPPPPAPPSPPPVKESVSINYKDAPPEIQRQMESAAGFEPAVASLPIAPPKAPTSSPNTNPNQAQRVVPQEQLTTANTRDGLTNALSQKLGP